MNTTPVPRPVEDARRVLTAVLAADPTPEDALAVSEALAVLVDVHPPYPPLGLEDDPTEPDIGIAAALALLEQAITTATDIPSLCRYGEVVVLLRRAPSSQPLADEP
ncbi:MAG TPA: hypothetical protein VI248_25590 [Kineosporiaceae bacterium]